MKYDGGQAFPGSTPYGICGPTTYLGMSLRDYFAIRLAAAWLSTFEATAKHPIASGNAANFAVAAYALADAMLEARKS